MKNLFKILLLTVFVTVFTSCKKNVDYHKISYEIEFLNGSITSGHSNFINVSTIPCDESMKIDRMNIPKSIRSDYYGLKKGDKVHFAVDAQTSYWFIMRVYLDDVEVSEREVKIGISSYYVPDYYNQTGRNDYQGDHSIIEFTY